MNTLKFILKKIVIIEVMLIILFFSINMFNVDVGILGNIINTLLLYLTPISIIAIVLYIILSILTTRLVETIISIVIGGLILYYLINYIL